MPVLQTISKAENYYSIDYGFGILKIFFLLNRISARFYVALDWARHKSLCACSSSLCCWPFWFTGKHLNVQIKEVSSGAVFHYKSLKCRKSCLHKWAVNKSQPLTLIDWSSGIGRSIAGGLLKKIRRKEIPVSVLKICDLSALRFGRELATV